MLSTVSANAELISSGFKQQVHGQQQRSQYPIGIAEYHHTLWKTNQLRHQSTSNLIIDDGCCHLINQSAQRMRLNRMKSFLPVTSLPISTK